MSVMFVCDGCGRREPGTWYAGHEEVMEERRCLAECGETFEYLTFTEAKWRRPLVDDGKPGGGNYWWTRQDEDGQQHACSRECIQKAADRSGKTRAVMPW